MPIELPPQENTPAALIGRDTEYAYVRLFNGKDIDGLKDGGKDVITNNPKFPFIQVKSSWPEALRFLSKSVEFKKFIPICIGEPGTLEEVTASIIKYGGWIAKDEFDREKKLINISKVRDYIRKLKEGK